MIIQNSLEKEILASANNYLKRGTVAPLSFQGYQHYLETGERISFETEYFARRKELTSLSLGYYLSQNPTCKELLEALLWEICNEYSWSLPAHLPIVDGNYQQARSWIDLFAAETAESLAEIKDLLKNDLSPLIKARIDEEIEARIFCPFEANAWSWEKMENNWSSVIAGSIGITALLQLPLHSPRQNRMIERLDTAMQSYLRGFGADGACVEGVGYWGYGFGYYIYYAAKLAEIWGDRRYLELEKVRKIATFPFHTFIRNNSYVPFSDYAQAELPSGLLSYCQEEFGISIPLISAVSSLDFDHCYRFAQVYRNWLWTKETNNLEIQSNRHYFDQVQWLILREKAPSFFFAAKGGSNDESHNHNDIGHFIIGTTEELFLTDLGAGEYTKDYFSEARYRYLVNSSEGHSLPIINGGSQLAGSVKAQQVSFVDQEKPIFQLDLTSTFDQEVALTNFIRRLTIDSCKRHIHLTDSFHFSKTDNQLIENFVTCHQPTVVGKVIILKGKNSNCRLTFTTDNLRVIEKKFSSHDGQILTAYLLQATYSLSQEAQITVQFQLE